MTRPTEVKVGPWTYAIEWPDDEQWHKDHERDNYGGISKHEESVIRVRVTEGRSEGSMRETLLHEIIHCVFTAVGLNHYTRPKHGDLDEYIITSMTPTLLAVLADNPEVLAYLTNHT